MTPIDPAKLIKTQRPQASVVAPLSRPAPAAPLENSAGSPRAPAMVPTLTGMTAGAEPPVEIDRVQQIRKAIEDGSYPLLPTRIADGMIAAGYLLRAPK